MKNLNLFVEANGVQISLFLVQVVLIILPMLAKSF